MAIRIKRVYEPPAPADGFRVLVDRLWPRGLTKEAAKLDLWLKEIAPSHELRKWFHQAPGRWGEFKARYRAELKTPEPAAALIALRQILKDHRNVTLLFGAREEVENHAAVLRDLLKSRR
jgi:uncharacterized protein YeaO (DUF488 family)